MQFRSQTCKSAPEYANSIIYRENIVFMTEGSVLFEQLPSLSKHLVTGWNEKYSEKPTKISLGIITILGKFILYTR